MVFAAGAVPLSVVALVGVWLPARRAARVEPVVALRMDLVSCPPDAGGVPANSQRITHLGVCLSNA